jgi:hypothetical protein
MSKSAKKPAAAAVTSIATETKFKIEKNIPLPARRLSSESMYPFAKMEIGDSFEIVCQTHGEAVARRSVLSPSWVRFRPKKFTSRVEDTCVRVWRVE